jgi:glycosyltransferase involved in cell wall biosynthesis
MNVGIVAEGISIESLKYIFEGINQSLAKRHKVTHRPLEFFYSSSRRQEELLEQFVSNSDILVGNLDEDVLRTRERLERKPPLMGFFHGCMSRGAAGDLPQVHHYLKSTDFFVGNCGGDVAIARKFFKNIQVRNLPFSYDETTFYPIDESQRQVLKAELGFRKTDRILLYAGRVTLEKNVHTQLRILSVLQRLMPNLHVVIIGGLQSVPFHEFGVHTPDITGMLTRLLYALRLDIDRVHFLGHRNPTQTRNYYIVADALVNLTLHHDENFGLAQVEAMACGTPVIGTKWGGLIDSIKHNETGYHISTVVTDTGIKPNWWEAMNRIVQLLSDEFTRQRFRENGPVHVREHFSKQRYDEVLESIVVECKKASENKSEPLALSEFGAEFWQRCRYQPMSPPPYQRGQRSLELYKELIAHFTGVTENTVPVGENLKADQILVQAAPVQAKGRSLRIDDPIFPMEVIVPASYEQTCHAVLEILRREPVVQLEHLQGSIDSSLHTSLDPVLKWMLNAGILLRTRPMNPAVDPKLIGDQMAKPLFTVQVVDYRTDVFVIKQMW